MIEFGQVGIGVDFRSIAEFSLDNVNNLDTFWDQVWQKTYATDTDAVTTSLTIQAFVAISRYLLAFLLPFFFFLVARAVMTAGGGKDLWARTVPLFIATSVVVILLGNDASALAHIQLGIRDVIHSSRDFILKQSVLEHQLKDAITDQVLTDATRAELLGGAIACKSLPAPLVALPEDGATELTQEQQQLSAHFRCWEKLIQRAESITQEADANQNVCGNSNACKGLKNFLDRLTTSLKGAVTSSLDKIKNGDLAEVVGFGTFKAGLLNTFAGSALWSGVKPILGAIQILYVFSLELALWLSGIVAPLMVVLVIIPPLQGAALAWLMTILSIGLNQIVYAALVGLLSLGLSETNSVNFSEIGFYLIIALGAPIISSSIVFGGAQRVTQSLFSNAFAITSAGVGLGIGGIGAAARAGQVAQSSSAPTSSSSAPTQISSRRRNRNAA